MPAEKITTRQIIGFIFISRLSFALSSMPVIAFPPYNQDLWITILLSMVYLFIFSTPILFLANKFREDSMVGCIKRIYGKRLGKVLGILYGFYFIANTINSLTLQTELVVTSVLPDASNVIISVAMMATCVYIVSRGAVTILRGSDIFTPFIIIVFWLLVFLGFRNVDFNVLLPILKDSSLGDINKGAMMLALIYSDLFLLVMLIPELENKKKINMIFTISSIGSLLFLIVALIVTQGTLGIELTRHTVFPFYKYTRLIDVFEIFERIDAVFVFIWILTSITRICGFTYISVRAFREVFDKKEDEKIILYIVAIIILAISVAIIQRRPVIGIRKDFDTILDVLYVIFLISIPLITCIVYFFRRNSIKEEESKDQ